MLKKKQPCIITGGVFAGIINSENHTERFGIVLEVTPPNTFFPGSGCKAILPDRIEILFEYKEEE